MINLAVWFFQPVLGDTIFWITGSANYLWGMFFILLFLLPYRLFQGQDISKLKSIIQSAVLFFFGILAGWTNENSAGAMILITILLLLFYHYQQWQIPTWGISGIIGSIIGFSLMILAPGNFERAGESFSINLFTIAYRLFNCTFTFFYYCGPVILCSILMPILYRYLSKKEADNTNLKITLIYYIGAIAAVYAMLVSTTFPRRALFGVVTFLIIGIGVLLYNLDTRKEIVKRLKISVISIGIIGFLFTFYWATREIGVYRNMVEKREVNIEEAKAKGLQSCEFERYDGGKYIHGEDPFSATLMSRYYRIDIILRNPD
jgi:hypothetical protein